MAIARQFPHIWTTWLPRLLTGEDSCEWAIWFKAHHQNWAKAPSDFNQTEWVLNHTSLLNEKKSQWEARGHDVYVEGQNSFRLRGQSATLAGRPDLIVDRNNEALIIDVKAGREQPSHVVQIISTCTPCPERCHNTSTPSWQEKWYIRPGPHEYPWAASTPSSKRTSEP